MTPSAHDVLVVGGGPAGLAAAQALVRRGREPLVLEASDAPGGMLRGPGGGSRRLRTPSRSPSSPGPRSP